MPTPTATRGCPHPNRMVPRPTARMARQVEVFTGFLPSEQMTPGTNRDFRFGFPFWLFVPSQYTPDRLCWCRPLGVFHPARLRWPGEGASSASSRYEKRPQGLIASDFSDTLPSHPPSFHLFPSLPSRPIGVCPPYLITCVGTRMDKGVGKHQKVRLLAVKTEIRDETAGLSPSFIRKLTTLLDWHRCPFTSRY
jgi:hypothetical protein